MKTHTHILPYVLILCGFGGIIGQVLGQCGVYQHPVADSVYIRPVALIQITGCLPISNGALLTQVWTDSTNTQACCSSGSLQSRFDRAFRDTVNGFPAHFHGPASDSLLYPSLGIDSRDSSSYNWPNSGPEQAQQDGWLIIPPSIDTIFFKAGNTDVQASALFISNATTTTLNRSLQGMEKILEDQGGSNGQGDSVCWIVPANLPSFGPGNAFRYARIRIYHYDLEGYANSTILWDIGDGLEKIAPQWLQSVSSSDSVNLAPNQTDFKCFYAYRDRMNHLFERLSNSGIGDGFVLDPRKIEQLTVMFEDVNANSPVPRPFDCRIPYSWVRIDEQKPTGGGQLLMQKWDTIVAYSYSGNFQRGYRQAFPDFDADGFPTRSAFNPSSQSPVSVQGLGSTESSIMGFTTGPDQVILDGWLAVPPKIKCIPFRLGADGLIDASALWVGLDYPSMGLIVEDSGTGASEASFCLPPSSNNSWRWIRVRMYTYDKTGNHNTHVEWDMGSGFVPIPPEYLRTTNFPNSNIPPGALTFGPPTFHYGLQDTSGTVWVANGMGAPFTTWNFKDDLSLHVTFESLDPFDSSACTGQNPPTTGPYCDSTLASDPCNKPPEALDTTIYLVKEVTDTLDVLLYAQDPNPGDSIFIDSIFISFPGGTPTAILNNQFIEYVPENDFADTTSFQYIIWDDRSYPLNDTGNVILIIGEDSDGDQLSDLNDYDDDNDGIPDHIEDAFADADDDSLRNSLDLDSDNDGIPDIIESGGRDPDRDGMMDLNIEGLLMYDTTDVSGTGAPDGWADNAVGDSVDSDLDGYPDFLDLDADNDGQYDLVEAGGPISLALSGGVTPPLSSPHRGWNGDSSLNIFDTLDFDHDTIPARLDIDSDNDGIPNIIEEGWTDVDSNGRTDIILLYPLDDKGVVRIIDSLADSDRDRVPNYLDLDSDNDGIPDVVEAGFPHLPPYGLVDTLIQDENGDGLADTITVTQPLDMDGDLFPDFLDLDADNDGIFDIAEEGRRKIQNFQANGRVEFQLNNPNGWYTGDSLLGFHDSDCDSVPDRIDLDSDNDGIPDVIERGITAGISQGRISPIQGQYGADDTTLSVPGDWDGDQVMDYLDLDSDQDGIVDAIEAGGILPENTGRFGGPYQDGWTTINGGHLDDTLQFHSDDDGYFNQLDLDSDNDAIPDIIESGRLSFCDTTAQVDSIYSVDTLLNGIPPTYSPDAPRNLSDGWGDNLPFLLPVNTDQLGFPDFKDLDSDGDSLKDVMEATAEPLHFTDEGRVKYEIMSTGWNSESGVIKPLNTDLTLGYPEGDNRRDTILDFRDLDADGDGLSDSLEYGLILSGETPASCNPEGFPNYRDPRPCAPRFVEAFSPNGDGTNEGFKIWGIEYYALNQLTVYNRWGNKVYSAVNYPSQHGLWKGELSPEGSATDTPLPEGVYFFTFIDTRQEENPTVLKKGFVYILR